MGLGMKSTFTRHDDGDGAFVRYCQVLYTVLNSRSPRKGLAATSRLTVEQNKNNTDTIMAHKRLRPWKPHPQFTIHDKRTAV